MNEINHHIKTIQNFYLEASELRNYIDTQFSNPLEAHGERFVWDYWFVKEQYNLIRTPAYHYFPEQIYNAFHDYLVQWGRQNLGCANISPPWLSYYVDGCFQNWHADVPHGPWAFVYSLTPWEERQFQGGRTQILKPQTLNFWNNFDSQQALEANDIIEKIPCPFNQLTLFDPRLPHGVEEVKGERDPQKSRMVIHGWFTEPEPILEGYEGEDISEALNNHLSPLIGKLSDLGPLTGILCYRFDFTPEGKLKTLTTLTNTLKSTATNNSANEALTLSEKSLKTLTLLPNPKPYTLTLPLIFE